MPIPNQLLLPEREALLEALLECSRMQSVTGRELILSDLRVLGVKAVDEVSAAPDNKTHTLNIIDALAKEGDLGAFMDRVLHYDGEKKEAVRLIRVKREIEQTLFEPAVLKPLRELMEHVTLPTSDLARTFLECSRELTIKRQDQVHGPYEMLLVLASFTKQKLGFPYPALAFLEKIAATVADNIADDLREISEKVAAEHDITPALRDLRAKRAWQSLTGTATLVFEMRPKADGFMLRASLLSPDGRCAVLPTEDSPVSEKVARERFRDLVMRAEQESTELLIEVVLPREMLCCSVDRWEIDVGGYEAPVGGQYPVVVRWLERLRDKKRFEPRWRQKWAAVKSHSGQPLWVTSADQFQPRQLLAILGQSPDQGAFVSFAFTPPEKTGPQGDSLSIALSGGTPEKPRDLSA